MGRKEATEWLWQAFSEKGTRLDESDAECQTKIEKKKRDKKRIWVEEGRASLSAGPKSVDTRLRRIISSGLFESFKGTKYEFLKNKNNARNSTNT